MPRRRIFAVPICGLLLAALPLPAQEVVAGAANLMHRAAIDYPPEARDKQIQGAVTVEATLNERGLVTDARVTSGPEILRKPVLKSVLEWHYLKGTPSPVQIAVSFTIRQPTPQPVFLNGVPTIVKKGPPGAASDDPPKEIPKWDAGIIEQIRFNGVPRQFEETLLGRLPVREGEPFQTDMISRIEDTLKGFDEHLKADYRMLDFDGEKRSFELKISYSVPVETAGQRSAH